MPKPKEQKGLIIAGTIFLTFLIFSASFFFVLIDRSFYDKSFTKYGAYKNIGVDGVRSAVDNLINYLTSENTEVNQLNTALFTEKEVSHLHDVRTLVLTAKYVSIVFLLLLAGIIFWLNKDDYLLQGLKKILLYSSIAGLAIIAFVFIASFNFTWLFETFHKILFPQGNYSFPATSILIQLFPEGFFLDYARTMLFHALIICLVFLFLGTTSALTVNNSRRHKMRNA